MDRMNVKQQVIDGARLRLQEAIAEHRERLEDLRSVTMEADLSETASQSEGRREADVELMNGLGDQLEHLERDMALLGQVDAGTLHEAVSFGSVVHTDRRDLLIATSVEEFEAAGRTYLGLSVRAPLYQALSGKRVGEQATVNGVTYIIRDIL